MMTYGQATAHHMQVLDSLDDWEAHYHSPKRYSPKPLVTPYAQHVSGLKIYFKPQATWYGWDRPLYSLHVDRRTATTAQIIADAEYYTEQRS